MRPPTPTIVMPPEPRRSRWYRVAVVGSPAAHPTARLYRLCGILFALACVGLVIMLAMATCAPH